MTKFIDPGFNYTRILTNYFANIIYELIDNDIIYFNSTALSGYKLISFNFGCQIKIDI